MKTQLLEDIGQSAHFSFTPPKATGVPKAEQEAGQAAAAGTAPAARSRAAGGVWRQNPAGASPGEAVEPATQAPAPLPEESTAQELDRLVEELTALEAQLVPAGERQEPALAPAETGPAPRVPPPASPRQPAAALPEPQLEHDRQPDPMPVPGAAASHEPSFDFTPPPARQSAEPFFADSLAAEPAVADAPVAEPFTPAARGSWRAGPRYLAWAACLFAAVLLVVGGRWWYQERRDAGALAVIADATKEDPRAVQGLASPAPAAQQSAREAGVDAAAAPPAAARRPSTPVPPLVMLEEQPGVPVKREQPAQAAAAGQAPSAAPAPAAPVKPAAVVKEEPLASSPKPKSQTPPKPKAQTPAKPKTQTPPKPSRAAAVPAKETRQREPVRQVARASAAAKEAPLGAEDSLSETLKACRAHGYHATQCIKQGCGMTKYGFACRGR